MITKVNEFEDLMREYRAFAQWYIAKLGVPSCEREDLLQEGMIGLLRAVRTYDGASASFATYASVCIKRAVITALRKYSRYANIVTHETQIANISSIDNPTESALLRKENSRILLDAVAGVLSSFEYAVFELYLQGNTPILTAKTLGMGQKSVSNALTRARTKLRIMIKPDLI